jgi:hypothetical protein
MDLSRVKYPVGWTFGILRPCAAADEAESKERAPHMPNQRARRAALKFSLSARNPTEGS